MIACLFILLFLIGGCTVNKNQYTNPVFEPVLADPTIVKADDGYYYAYGTEDAWGEKTKPKLIPIVRSKNLTEWEYVGEAFNEKPTWKMPGGLWAPDIAKYKGKYYLYYSVSIWGDTNPGIGVAVSDNPEGPFQDQGKLFTSEEIGVANSIDPYFMLDDGKPYLFWGSFHGIYGVELAEDGLSIKGEKFQIAGDAYEAPYIIKRDGYYYFFGSMGSCCEGENSTYHVAVGRSKTLKGPYQDKTGKDILSNGGTVILQGNKDGSFVGPGHNAIVTDDEGTDWIIYHAIEKEDPLLWTGASRRPLMIDPLIWEEGWPKVENLVPGESKQKAPVLNGT